MTNQEFCILRNNTHLSLNVLCFMTYRRGEKGEIRGRKGRKKKREERREGRRVGGQEEGLESSHSGVAVSHPVSKMRDEYES